MQFSDKWNTGDQKCSFAFQLGILAWNMVFLAKNFWQETILLPPATKTPLMIDLLLLLLHADRVVTSLLYAWACSAEPRWMTCRNELACHWHSRRDDDDDGGVIFVQDRMRNLVYTVRGGRDLQCRRPSGKQRGGSKHRHHQRRRCRRRSAFSANCRRPSRWLSQVWFIVYTHLSASSGPRAAARPLHGIIQSSSSSVASHLTTARRARFHTLCRRPTAKPTYRPTYRTHTLCCWWRAAMLRSDWGPELVIGTATTFGMDTLYTSLRVFVVIFNANLRNSFSEWIRRQKLFRQSSPIMRWSWSRQRSKSSSVVVVIWFSAAWCARCWCSIGKAKMERNRDGTPRTVIGVPRWVVIKTHAAKLLSKWLLRLTQPQKQQGGRCSLSVYWLPPIVPVWEQNTGCGRKKSRPLNFFAVFSATVWDFNMKFYGFIYWNLLHLTAK